MQPLGLEGIVSKRRDAPYRSGRSPHWLKVKESEQPGRKADRRNRVVNPRPISSLHWNVDMPRDGSLPIDLDHPLTLGYVQGHRKSLEARKVRQFSGRATYIDGLADDEVDGTKLIPLLRRGCEAWNQWRKQNRRLRPIFKALRVDGPVNFDGFNFANTGFVGARFHLVTFNGARLSGVDAKSADFDKCEFVGTNMKDANFFQ